MSRWAIATICVLVLAGKAQAEPALADLIKAGDREAALEMIRAGTDVNAAQGDGTTPLHWAVYKIDSGLVKALLAHGAKADVKNNFGASPLAEAVKVADTGLVRMLLKAGANVEAANDDGETALMLAARTGVLEVADLLVRHGADVNSREAWRGQTALMWAAAENHPEMTEFLVAHGANVSARAMANDWPNQVTSEPRAQYRPTGGLTPLLYAVRAGCQRCVQAILKAGADINLPTPDGVTPLMTAIDNLHFDVGKYLLEHGANPHTWDWWGRTPLYVAVDMNSFSSRRGPQVERSDKTTAIDIMRMLLAAGVNRNPQLNMHRPGRGGNSGRFTDDLLTTGATPLLRAAIGFDNEAITVLLEHGALVDLPNAMGVTPFMAAAGLGVSVRDPRGSYNSDVQSRVLPTLEILVKAGADVNARVTDTSGRTARIARPSTMTNRQGQTALYGAINWGWTRVVQFLLDHGAKVDIADATGKTPLDATQGNAGGRDAKVVEDVVALIKKAGAGGA
jgi:ankyrin repeat protein